VAVSLAAALPASAQVNPGPVYAGVPDILMPVVMPSCHHGCLERSVDEGDAASAFANPTTGYGKRDRKPSCRNRLGKLTFAPTVVRRQ
jgi:hypothetical protein